MQLLLLLLLLAGWLPTKHLKPQQFCVHDVDFYHQRTLYHHHHYSADDDDDNGDHRHQCINWANIHDRLASWHAGWLTGLVFFFLKIPAWYLPLPQKQKAVLTACLS